MEIKKRSVLRGGYLRKQYQWDDFTTRGDRKVAEKGVERERNRLVWRNGKEGRNGDEKKRGTCL